MDDNEMSCKACQKAFTSPVKFHKHNASRQHHITTAKNEIAKKETKRKHLLKATRERKQAYRDAKTFHCNLCTRSYGSNSDLNKHYRTSIHITKKEKAEVKL